MALHFIDFPSPVENESYQSVAEQLVAWCASRSEILAVYQFGGVSSPGISDLDIFCIIEDGKKLMGDPREGLDRVGRYICTHGLLACPRQLLSQMSKYSWIQQYKLLSGADLLEGFDITAARDQQMKTQMELEFLVKAYLRSRIELAYGIVKLRSLLLEVHALRYDLDCLGPKGESLSKLVAQVSEWRKNWFSSPPSSDVLSDWFYEYSQVLEQTLSDYLSAQSLFVPNEGGEYRLARHLALVPSKRLSIEHRGFVPYVPKQLKSQKVFNLFHRFNRFKVGVPMEIAPTGSATESRFQHWKKAKTYSTQHFPYFEPVLFGLGIY